MNISQNICKFAHSKKDLIFKFCNPKYTLKTKQLTHSKNKKEKNYDCKHH